MERPLFFSFDHNLRTFANTNLHSSIEETSPISTATVRPTVTATPWQPVDLWNQGARSAI